MRSSMATSTTTLRPSSSTPSGHRAPSSQCGWLPPAAVTVMPTDDPARTRCAADGTGTRTRVNSPTGKGATSARR